MLTHFFDAPVVLLLALTIHAANALNLKTFDLRFKKFRLKLTRFKKRRKK